MYMVGSWIDGGADKEKARRERRAFVRWSWFLKSQNHHRIRRAAAEMSLRHQSQA
jgi:hypothetical protein